MSILALLTDFGAASSYVGIMKGVCLARAPQATLVDLSHTIHPQHVMEAGLTLAGAVAYFPARTTFLCVVDPGVGSERAILAAVVDGRQFVAPDNGLLDPVLSAGREREVVRVGGSWLAGAVSSTFHGRDIMAPVAAHLAGQQGRVRELGEAVTSWVPLSIPAAEPGDGGVAGEVLYLDPFGNAITNLPADCCAEATTLEVAGRTLPLVRTYADVAAGAGCALVGSTGWVEVALRDGSAGSGLSLTPGMPVRLV